MAEWLKAHAWKACNRKRFAGSNPAPSAIFIIQIGEKINISIDDFLKLVINKSLYKKDINIKDNLLHFIELYFKNPIMDHSRFNLNYMLTLYIEGRIQTINYY